MSGSSPQPGEKGKKMKHKFANAALNEIEQGTDRVLVVYHRTGGISSPRYFVGVEFVVRKQAEQDISGSPWQQISVEQLKAAALLEATSRA